MFYVSDAIAGRVWLKASAANARRFAPRGIAPASPVGSLGVTTEQLLSDEDNPYERLRLRISKFNYSTMLDEMIQTMCKEDRKEFLQYARLEIQKRLSRIAEDE